jgi:hypothetical protein
VRRARVVRTSVWRRTIKPAPEISIQRLGTPPPPLWPRRSLPGFNELLRRISLAAAEQGREEYWSRDT